MKEDSKMKVSICKNKEGPIICNVCKKKFIGLVGFHKTCWSCVQRRTDKSVIIKNMTVLEILAKPIELNREWNDKLVDIRQKYIT